MKKRPAAFWLMMGLWTSGTIAGGPAPAQAGWQAGTARAAITPGQSTWMSGYSARTRPSEGAVHDLWAKAMALQDPAGQRAVLITLDLVGIDRAVSNRIRETLQARRGLARDRIVLACSHTHCGPVVGTNLVTMYKLDDAQRLRITEYTQSLETTVVKVAEQALDHLQDVRLSWGIGVCDFAVNRRNNKEADVPKLRQQLALLGPDDHDVPVLRVARADGSPLAVIFGYACHCTVLDFYKFCGDYAGFAQVELEARWPGAQAMFVAGCGADQNPIPRRRLELAVTYGKQLAESVARVLEGPLRPVEGPLRSSYEEIALAFAPLPSQAAIEQDTKSTNFYVASRAKHLLEIIATRGHLDQVYPYPVEVWRLDDLTWIFLGGEVVVDYSLRIKRNLGSSHTWISAYCNDVMAYIPSQRVLKEGGYEGATAMIYYGQPTVWSDRVEDAIIEVVGKLTRAVSPEHPAGSTGAGSAGRGRSAVQDGQPARGGR